MESDMATTKMKPSVPRPFDVDIDEMTNDELEKLATKINDKLQLAHEQKLERIRIECEALAAQVDCVVVLTPKGQRQKASNGRMKYRLPSGKLWSGHGKRPHELRDYEINGGKREDLLITSAS